MDDAIRGKILKLLDQHRIMTVATVPPDGWPQATTVGYVNNPLFPLWPGKSEGTEPGTRRSGLADDRP